MYLFDNCQGLTGLGITLPPVREEWRPNLQQVMMSGGESILAAVQPSFPGVAPSWPVVSTAATTAVILVVTAEVGSEVTLMIPPPTTTTEERRETGLPASPGGGTHGSPSWSELEGSGVVMARPEAEHLPTGRGVEIVEIPYSDEAGTRVEPPAIPPSQELVVVRSSHDVAVAGSSSGLGATCELVWPCPSDPRKARFILHDEEEVVLWHFLEERGLSMESDLAQTKARLKEALERVELVHHAVTVDMPCVMEVSSLCF